MGRRNWLDEVALDCAIAAVFALGVIGGLVDRKVLERGKAGRKGTPPLRERVVDPELKNHVEHVVSADIVGAAKRRHHHRAQEQMLDQRQPNRLQHAQPPPHIFAVVERSLVGDQRQQPMQLHRVDP